MLTSLLNSGLLNYYFTTEIQERDRLRFFSERYTWKGVGRIC